MNKWQTINNKLRIRYEEVEDMSWKSYEQVNYMSWTSSSISSSNSIEIKLSRVVKVVGYLDTFLVGGRVSLSIENNTNSV